LAQKYDNYPSLSAKQKKEFVKLALNFIGRFQSEIEKAHYISYLAKKVSVAEVTIEEILSKTRLQPKSKSEEKDKIATTIEDRVISYLLNFPNLLKGEKLGDIEFENQALGAIYIELKACYNQGQSVTQEIKKIESKLSRDVKERLDAVSVSWDQKIAEEEDVAREDFQEIKSYLEKRQKEKIKSDFAKAIAQAETSGDISKVKELMKNLQESLK
jgi:hypothetical protein